MFQPNTYHEKRGVVNEMLLQQMAGLLRAIAPQQFQGQVNAMLDQYGRSQQILRDAEARRVLGEFTPIEGVEYVDQPLFLEYLKANVGRTYFGTSEHTPAPSGAIGTAGFSKKFDEWLAGLPNFDEKIGPDMESGFYRDDMSHPQRKSLPILVIRNGRELTIALYFGHLSIMTLNLDNVPAEYNWSAPNHYPLRGEMFTYRGNISKSEFQTQFGAALAAQGDLWLQEPKLETVTTGLVQTDDVVVEALVETPAE